MAKTEKVDAAPAADETTTAPEAVAPRSPRPGLAIAGVVGGGLVVAALLFGAGFATGSAMPHGPRAPHSQVEQGAGPQGPAQLGPQGGERGPHDGQRGPQGGKGDTRPAPEAQEPDEG